MESYSAQPYSLSIILWRFMQTTMCSLLFTVEKCVTVEKSAPPFAEPFTFENDIRAASTLGLLQIKRLWTSVGRLLCEHSSHFSGINAHGCHCWVGWLVACRICLRHCQTVLQGAGTAAHPRQHFLSDPISPHFPWHLVLPLVFILAILIEG